jgi:hypothetical protein
VFAAQHSVIDYISFFAKKQNFASSVNRAKAEMAP